MILSGPPRATGPALAARFGGTFDSDNGRVIITPDYYIICTISGGVWLKSRNSRGKWQRHGLGRMSDGVECIVENYCRVTGLPDPASVTE